MISLPTFVTPSRSDAARLYSVVWDYSVSEPPPPAQHGRRLFAVHGVLDEPLPTAVLEVVNDCEQVLVVGTGEDPTRVWLRQAPAPLAPVPVSEASDWLRRHTPRAGLDVQSTEAGDLPTLRLPKPLSLRSQLGACQVVEGLSYSGETRVHELLSDWVLGGSGNRWALWNRDHPDEPARVWPPKSGSVHVWQEYNRLVHGPALERLVLDGPVRWGLITMGQMRPEPRTEVVLTHWHPRTQRLWEHRIGAWHSVTGEDYRHLGAPAVFLPGFPTARRRMKIGVEQAQALGMDATGIPWYVGVDVPVSTAEEAFDLRQRILTLQPESGFSGWSELPADCPRGFLAMADTLIDLADTQLTRRDAPSSP